MRFSYKLATCTLAIAVSTISTAALAQDAGDTVDDSSGANEIVVTAQKRDERLQDVPIAVTAFTPDQLTQSGISSRTGCTVSVSALPGPSGSGRVKNSPS